MRRIIDACYVVVMFLVIIIPVATMNLKKNQVSLIDNTVLPELAISDTSADEFKKSLEKYIEKRIGYRNQAIYTYQVVGEEFFNIIESPLFILGNDGHIMGGNDSYIRDYQRVNVDENMEFIGVYTDFLSCLHNYLDERNILFLYFLVPDKKTIYPEGFPNYINREKGRSKTDLLIENLDCKAIPYVYPMKFFLEKKLTTQLYNKQYDILHWNFNGNFWGNKIVDEYLINENRNITPLRIEDYNIEYIHKDKTTEPGYPIDEDVPIYKLVGKDDSADISRNDSYISEYPDGSLRHYINACALDAPSILIVHDSYLGESDIFYTNRYREVIMAHVSNYNWIVDLVNKYNPDVVVFENVERVIRYDDELWDLEVLEKCIDELSNH